MRAWSKAGIAALAPALIAAAIAVPAAGAVPAAWTAQAALSAPDFAANDHFGQVVISAFGTTAIVGAPGKTVGGQAGAGAAYVFVDNGSGWTYEAELTASDAGAGDGFATAVSTTKDGSTVVIGAPFKSVAGKPNAGAAYVFTRSGTTWTQKAELTGAPSGRGNQFGASVGINGEGALVAVGAPVRTIAGHRRAGAAYAFKRTGQLWSQNAFLTPSDGAAGDRFGWAIAVKETQVVVSSPFHANADGSSGTVYGFEAPTGTYEQKTVLTAGDGKANDRFGWSLDISIATMVVGAPNHVVGTTHEGAAYVFTHNDRTGIWTPRTELTPADGQAGDNFGIAVAISGTVVIVGDTLHDVGVNSAQGVAYVYTGAASTWTRQAELTAADGIAHTEFGQFVAASTTTVMVGEPQHAVGGSSGAGVVDPFVSS
jgi:hypothetical protein